MSNNKRLMYLIINNSSDTDCSNQATPITNVNILSFSNFTNTTTDVNLNNKMVINPTQQSFLPHYGGPILIRVECIDSNKNLGNWYPLKAVRFF